MRLQDLPRLSDDERRALNDCAAVEGVPTDEAFKRWRDERRAQIVDEVVTARAPRIAIAADIAVSLFLSGCSLTPTQQKWAGFAAGVLVVGAIAAHDSDNGKPVADDKHGPFNPCPSGDSQNCK